MLPMSVRVNTLYKALFAELFIICSFWEVSVLFLGFSALPHHIIPSPSSSLA